MTAWRPKVADGARKGEAMQRNFHEFVFIARPLAAAGLERVANHLQCVGRAKWLKYLAATMGLPILFCLSICWHSFVL